jgi:hypothetical protein
MFIFFTIYETCRRRRSLLGTSAYFPLPRGTLPSEGPGRLYALFLEKVRLPKLMEYGHTPYR